MNELSIRDPETFWKPDAADRAEARASPQRSQTTNGRDRVFYVPIRPRGARGRPRRPPVVRAAIPVGQPLDVNYDGTTPRSGAATPV